MKVRMTAQPHHSVPAVVPPANLFSVLVIDDLGPNRMLLGKILAASGYAVTEASNGSEALELIEQGGLIPDLILTDIEMPVMDGITLIERIRGLDHPVAAVPIIAASGNADAHLLDEALDAGSNVFLTKPFDISKLRREVAKLLTARRRKAGQRAFHSSPDPRVRREGGQSGTTRG